MKWANHDIISFSVPFAVTGDWTVSIVAALFSTLPDVIEGKPDHRLLSHRGRSHNPWFWMIAGGILVVAAATARKPIYSFVASHGIPASPYLSVQVALAGIVGVLVHLLGDALTPGGIPISLDSKRRISLNLFKTGTLSEYCFTYLFLFSVLLLRWHEVDRIIHL